MLKLPLLKWQDMYLTYNFLKKDPYRNVLKEKVQQSIWTPLYSLSLLKDSDLFETASNFFVERVGKPKMSNEANETYPGNENSLTATKKLKMTSAWFSRFIFLVTLGISSSSPACSLSS